MWLRTHRIGGLLFVAGGAIIIISSFAGRSPSIVAIIMGLGIALFLTGYAYFLYRRIEGHKIRGNR